MSQRFTVVCVSVLLFVWTGCANSNSLLSENSASTANDRSPIKLVSWPSVEMPTLWPETDGGSRSPLLAPFDAGMNTLRVGTNTLARGASQLQRGGATVWNNSMDGGARAWTNTKRLLTPPALAPSKSDTEPSFWQRVFAPEPPREPQTTREFLSQDRPDWGRS